MLGKIKSILLEPDDPVAVADEVPAAAAALLIEAAVLDGSYDASERQAIVRLLGERFDLSSNDLENLIAESEEAVNRSVELYGVTRILKNSFNHDERLELMIMLWKIVYADGKLHDYEANLVRRVAGLLHIPDKDVGFARKKAIECLDIIPTKA
ncbi:MAG: hypothetical protein CMF69_07275 [Magnetovibrio sp.]|nr:hypothetical protein [Magnetovibrio sp.]|tara:strand:- start:3195 stop:3656 length:462 start_codon:yes stop_codon:yes gene_type:complete